MKVFSRETGHTLLIGRCDIEDDGELVHVVPLFGPTSVIMEPFGIGAATFFREDGSFFQERGVFIVPGQDPRLLPGWQPLAS